MHIVFSAIKKNCKSSILLIKVIVQVLEFCFHFSMNHVMYFPVFSCDLGGDCECLCTAIANFAEHCNRIGYPTRWRYDFKCGMHYDDSI